MRIQDPAAAAAAAERKSSQASGKFFERGSKFGKFRKKREKNPLERRKMIKRIYDNDAAAEKVMEK